ncbi:thymidylate synthase [Providencia huaxiensis]|uniref:thymidylate synthase n=1 Tax=Enterobacterales TaxID=91347 RepID=UPI000370BFEA|nr:thymidylate synthase [Klebsiella sp. LY]HDX8327521.1 thymidylate synthase [Raoultella ornithinolytica]HDX8339023.1 thymidylate synthase [Raoultella ornithinolytica]
MRNYRELLQEIQTSGNTSKDRTGVGTTSIWGAMLKFDLQKGFPTTTCKGLAWKAVVGELLWFLEGSTNVDRLRELTHGAGSTKRTIWDDNYENQGKALGYSGGELGPIYGSQWRDFSGVDQLQSIVEGLQLDLVSGVFGRRHLMSAWNPAALHLMTLPPCHVLYQCKLRVSSGVTYLDAMWYQRSIDSYLGLPFNITSYALLTHILASICGVEPGVLVFSGADVHIYNN